MSKISLTPNASGTGTFTIASPNSNTSRTLTLPDADGALLAGAQAPFIPAAVSGATQALDVGTYNFFDAGTLTADTTVSFTNVPTGARWTYTYETDIDASTAWDVSTASHLRSFSVGAQEDLPTGVFFKPDGLKMYVIGRSGVEINEYNLSTAWDISTASYLQTLSVSAQETSPFDVFFKPDGTKMYVLGSTGDDVTEYDLSTAWDISTASYLQDFSFSVQEIFPHSFFFKPDGLKMYVIGTDGDDVNEYNLSTAWNVSTASYSQSFSVSAQDVNPSGVFFKPDGLKMYISGQTGANVNEYNLSTAWDVSTASYLQNFSVSAQDTAPFSLFFKPDGAKMYVVLGVSDSVGEYNLGTRYTLSLPPSIENPPAEITQLSDRVAYTFFTADGGTNVYLINEEVL